jgi:hypothetical protein
MMNHLDAMLRDEHDAARLLAEVHGDALDDAVFDRASAYVDPLLACLKQEVVVPFGRLETIEDELFTAIEAFEERSGSDRVDQRIDAAIAAEKAMPFGLAETIQERLLKQLDSMPLPHKPARYVWPVLPLLSSLATTRNASLALLFLVALLTTAILFIAGKGAGDRDLLTLITQAYGTAYRDDLVVSVKSGTTLDCKNDGSLTIVNKAGTVAIRDAIALTVEKASERSVTYGVVPSSTSEKKASGGKVEFSVAKRSKRQRFVVETPYFDIHVVGTRFVVARERDEGISTTIFEGAVRISSRLFGDTVLLAGQTLTYTPDQGGLLITSRGAIENESGSLLTPGTPESARCRLQVVSTPVHATVVVNEKPAGVTPFATVVPSGTYKISVRSRGRLSADTVVDLRTVPLDLRFTLAFAPPVGNQKRIVASAPQRRAILSTDGKRIAAEQAKKMLGDAQLLESKDWKTAIDLYKRLAGSVETPTLYRETALFSLSRLTADKLRDTAAAMSNFSRYLILYPRGMFAGEALLRLSELELTRNPASAVEYFRKFLAITWAFCCSSIMNIRKRSACFRLRLGKQSRTGCSDAAKSNV